MMRLRSVYFVLLTGSLLMACDNKPAAEMYTYSPMAELMQEMVHFNQAARLEVMSNSPVHIPSHFYDIKERQATNNEQEDDAFKSMATLFLARLKALDGNPEPTVAYQQLINACIHCHNTYCGGPLKTIKRLQLSAPPKEDPEVE